MIKKLIDYLVHDLGVAPDVAVTIILTLFTFSLGFIITWTVGGISKFIKRMNYKKSLKIIIQDFLDSCGLQFKLLQKVSDQRGFMHGENYNIVIKSNFGQNYLSTLDIKVFIENFSSIFRKTRANEISDLFEIVETVKVSKDAFKEQIKTFYLSYEENLKKYNANLDGLRMIQDDLALEYYGKPVAADFANYIMSVGDVFTTWKENGGNTNIQVTCTELVNRLYNNALVIPPNPISRKVIDYCVQCRNAVANIANIESYMRLEIKNLEDIHKDAHKRGTLIFNKW